MDVGWNFRREHLRPEQRSHYVIVHGGDQPNVVPPEATVWYFFREWDYDRIRDLHALGTKMAQAAAMMTDTTMTERVLAATWPGYFNKPVAEALTANIKAVGMPHWSEADETLARAAQAELKAKVEGLKKEVAELKGPVWITPTPARTISPRSPGTSHRGAALSGQHSGHGRRITGRAASPWPRPSRTRAQPPAPRRTP